MFTETLPTVIKISVWLSLKVKFLSRWIMQKQFNDVSPDFFHQAMTSIYLSRQDTFDYTTVRA